MPKMCSVCEKESPDNAETCSNTACGLNFNEVSLLDRILDAREKRKKKEADKAAADELAKRPKGLLSNLTKAVKK